MPLRANCRRRRIWITRTGSNVVTRQTCQEVGSMRGERDVDYPTGPTRIDRGRRTGDVVASQPAKGGFVSWLRTSSDLGVWQPCRVCAKRVSLTDTAGA